MKVHPKQYVAAIKHIAQAWAKGCKCAVCAAVDNREQITVGRKK